MEIEQKKDLCIVHIGMHKTGSSSIQNMLFNLLNDTNFHYANLGNPNQSEEVYSLFSEYPEKYHGHVARARSALDVSQYKEKKLKMLIDGFKATGNSTIEIISGEDIGILNFNEILKLKEFLDTFFKTVKIIAYIRPPVSYIQSAFQELIKHGLSSFDFTNCNPNYERFEMFEKVFGRENMILRLFKSNKLYGDDIVLDFCNTLKISLDKNYNTIKDNESISLEALSLLYAYQKYINKFSLGPNIFTERKQLISALSKIGKSRLTFCSSVLQPIIEKNQQGIDYLEQIMLESLNEESRDHEGCIRCEDDLLRFTDETIFKLKELIGKENLPDDVLGNTPKDIAMLVDVLKNKLAIESGLISKTNFTNQEKILSVSEQEEYRVICEFDIDWSTYFSINNISDYSGDPVTHYIKNWRTQNLIIQNLFDTEYYLDMYPDIKACCINPLFHYMVHGKAKGRLGEKNNIKNGVIIGKDGWLFLAGGINNPLYYYNDPNFFADTTCKKWRDLLCNRKRQLANMNIEYLHLFVPDKIGVYSEYTSQTFSHFESHPISKLFTYYSNDFSSFVINPIPYFNEVKQSHLLFYKTDTHWTFWGCYTAFNLLITQLKLDIPARLLEHSVVEIERLWDLGAKLDIKKTEISEAHYFVKTAKREYINSLVDYKEKHGLNNEAGLHIGSNVVFLNDSKDIIQKKVVIFGDSFCEYRPVFLTAMFAEIFAEVHFVWSTSIDYEYIARVQPDIVISEIAERFMNRVPDDTFVLSKYVDDKMASLL